MKVESGSRIRRVYFLLMAFLGLTGAAQMPIFKRYYVADVPGLGWLADFHLTNVLHYIGAALLLGLGGFVLARVLSGEGRDPMGARGLLRLVLLAVLVLTGALRIVKNLSFATLSPGLVVAVDWTHLGAALAMGLAALVFAATRAGGRGPGEANDT